MEKKLRKIFALARATGISADALKHLLGIPGKIVSSAQTFNQAKAFFRQSKINSEKIFAHRDAMIEHAETFDQAMDALEETSFNSPEAEKALKKALSLATTKHIKSIGNHLANTTVFSWGERQQWLEKWNDLSLEQVAQAKKVGEFLKAFEDAPVHSPARVAALKGFCTVAEKNKAVDLLKEIDQSGSTPPAELLVLIEHYLNL